jgi:hypothetical protein
MDRAQHNIAGSWQGTAPDLGLGVEMDTPMGRHSLQQAAARADE